MAHLYRDLSVKSLYTDRKYDGGQRRWQEAIEESTPLYIGNLSFYTTEEQLYALFGKVGEVKRVRKDQLDEELVCAQPDEKGAPLERPSHTGGVAASFRF